MGISLEGLAPRYSIVREIGRGGVATVYQAVDSRAGAQVAIKVLRPEFWGSVNAQRFLREIEYLSDLAHPNILAIIDRSESEELPYFVTPYARSGSLRERLRRDGPMTLDTVLAIVAELSSAIDYAHSRNIIHRDIKPENVLFNGPLALLCDFGVARAITLSASEPRFSSSGVIVGTPRYMSPEQFLPDGTIDGRCDVYALGCVAYEMLTAEPPFVSSSVLSLAWAHTAQHPASIRAVRPDIPAALEAAVQSAMAKQISERPPSAGAFFDSLSAAAGRRLTTRA